jgi:hypothetical protein
MASSSPLPAKRCSKEVLPRRKFTPEEDSQLRVLVDKIGTKTWDEIAQFLPDRTARQCRDRYQNYLVGSLVTRPWTPEEDALLIEKFHQMGPKWVAIGKLLSGRSGNNVKNRWYKHLCKLAVPALGQVHQRPPAEPNPTGQNPTGITEVDWATLFIAPDPAPDNAGADWYTGFAIDGRLF